MLKNPLQERSQSGFPLSIGTGLALEKVFDPIAEVIDETRDVGKKIDRSRYNLHLINIETLIRNILSSIPGPDTMKLSVKNVYEVLVEEMDFLNDFYNQHGLRVEFYYHTYEYYKKHYKDKLRLPSTERQYKHHQLTERTIKKVMSKSKGIHKFTKHIRFSSTDSVLIFTHIPADLLSWDRFRLMDLLESHTAKVKSRAEFNSKYFKVGQEDMSFLPFTEYLLTTFGDTVMFKPDPLKKRKELLSSLSSGKVHPLTSEFSMGLLLKKN